MTAATDAILDRIIPLAPPEHLRVLVGMIEDRIGGDAGLDRLDEAVTFALTNWAPLFRQEEPDTAARENTTAAGETLTARVKREAVQRSQTPATPAPQSNPWAAGSISVTQQVVLTARDPARAARLKAEAGL